MDWSYRKLYWTTSGEPARKPHQRARQPPALASAVATAGSARTHKNHPRGAASPGAVPAERVALIPGTHALPYFGSKFTP